LVFSNQRPWRLALTQALPLPAPVEWIGWWLYTALPTCLEWNRHRERQVPEAVIQEMAAALADPHFGPSRAEGFAALCAVVPTHHDDLEPLLAAELAALDRRIRSARARETHWQLHGYSRLLDLERLLFLIRLLSRYPELDASDPITRKQLEAIVSPLPLGDLAERAAAFLGQLHGECFGDAGAIRTDLNWLEANGFCFGGETLAPIRLAEVPAAPHSGGIQGGIHGGHPTLGDGPVFQRVMTLLRHLLHQPFDRDPASTLTLHEQLIAALLPDVTASQPHPRPTRLPSQRTRRWMSCRTRASCCVGCTRGWAPWRLCGRRCCPRCSERSCLWRHARPPPRRRSVRCSSTMSSRQPWAGPKTKG
jgi:hypothetical protein